MRPACAASKSSVRCGPAPPKAPCSRCFRGGALRWDEGCCGNGCAGRFGTARASKHARERSGRSSRTRRSPVASVMSSTASRTWLESDHESRMARATPRDLVGLGQSLSHLVVLLDELQATDLRRGANDTREARTRSCPGRGTHPRMLRGSSAQPHACGWSHSRRNRPGTR